MTARSFLLLFGIPSTCRRWDFPPSLCYLMGMKHGRMVPFYGPSPFLQGGAAGVFGDASGASGLSPLQIGKPEKGREDDSAKLVLVDA